MWNPLFPWIQFTNTLDTHRNQHSPSKLKVIPLEVEELTEEWSQTKVLCNIHFLIPAATSTGGISAPKLDTYLQNPHSKKRTGSRLPSYLFRATEITAWTVSLGTQELEQNQHGCPLEIVMWELCQGTNGLERANWDGLNCLDFFFQCITFSSTPHWKIC